ncbi:MAG: hypothetical protein ACJASF_001631 [Vicingaceae bacterium]|jgi:hypothetical protein
MAQNYNPCVSSTPIHIVVLGSSTAAGTGPSSIDSAWVNRYRRHIQSINPQNLVTNLGVGGTTTYQIMPDWFADTTRPARNTTKNISEAVRQGADAVIINMPSNDAARGFTATEQLRNFRIIKSVADSFNIEVWVCTTQPRNFTNAKKLIQLEVRDSILAQYGSNALDFWTGFANTNNEIDSTYDSGDGVHLNGLAHRELNQRVINKQIPNHISDTLTYPDFSIRLKIPKNSCGDSSEQVSAVVSNLGTTSLFAFSLKFEVTVNNQTTLNTFVVSGGLSSCASDTVNFNLNTSMGGTFQVRTYLDSSDTIPINDTSDVAILKRISLPSITATNTFYCPTDSAFMLATSASTNTIVWYDSLNSNSPIHFGNSYSFVSTNNLTNIFVEAVSGPLHFKEDFDLTRTTTTHWNGQMFDIISNDTLTLDSLEIPINTLGNQKVVAYYRYGSHKNFENNMGSWTYWGVDSFNISAIGEVAPFNFPDVQLTPNDTFAIYIHLQNPSSRLSYQSASASVFTNNKLAVPSGSGIANTFGTVYYPRNFSGKIHYHYGFNPLGVCQSPRIPVAAIQSEPYLDLGKDTAIVITDSLYLLANGFTNYNWSNGDTTQQLLVSSATFGVGTHSIFLTVLDSLGCMNSDTIVVIINNTTSVSTNSNSNFIRISPNPSNGYVEIEGLENGPFSIVVFDTQGKTVFESTMDKDNKIDFRLLPKGVYFLTIYTHRQRYTKKVIFQ